MTSLAGSQIEMNLRVGVFGRYERWPLSERGVMSNLVFVIDSTQARTIFIET